MKNLISQHQLADFLGVSEWSIWAMRKRGELPPAIRVGKALRWRCEVIEEWLQTSESPSDEFDSVYSERAQKAVSGKNISTKNPAFDDRYTSKKRGRKTKKEMVESRGK